jgi:hypothetical protein
MSIYIKKALHKKYIKSYKYQNDLQFELKGVPEYMYIYPRFISDLVTQKLIFIYRNIVHSA